MIQKAIIYIIFGVVFSLFFVERYEQIEVEDTELQTSIDTTIIERQRASRVWITRNPIIENGIHIGNVRLELRMVNGEFSDTLSKKHEYFRDKLKLAGYERIQ